MNEASSNYSYRLVISRRVPAFMSLLPRSYTLVLLAIAPRVSSITFNPVLMTDENKAKEYGLGAAALFCSTLSLLASILCMYWFCRMGKRFRHRLIMILVYGDLVRGVWLLVFAIISLARGTVKTESTLCQVSGFLVQYGTQTSDYAVLVIALHSATQVFYPSTLVSSDGLYPCRRYVYGGAIVLPILMAGLAFINPLHAYVSLGAFCTLPIRPFWYRLAFTWVPRYLIILIIIGLAIAIYIHVGFEFRAYSNVDTSFQSLKTSDGSQEDTQNELKVGDITFELTNMQSSQQSHRRTSSIGHDIFTSQRQASSIPSLHLSSKDVARRVSFESGNLSDNFPGNTLDITRSGPDTTRPILLPIPSGQSITAPISLDRAPCSSTRREDDNHSNSHDNNNDFEPAVTPSSSSIRTPSPPSSAQIRLNKQRQRVYRQLRLMFIYPLVYTLMWLIPFAMHCMNYWDRYALNPVEFLRAGSGICIALMGFFDALIFSLREKPWRGIDKSDGTFWGSFVIPRKAVGDVEVDAEGNQTRTSQSHRTGGSGDFARTAAEQARQRLDLEREERLKRVDDCERPRRSQGDEGDGEYREHGGLNVGDGKEGQVYDDNGLEDDTAKKDYNHSK